MTITALLQPVVVGWFAVTLAVGALAAALLGRGAPRGAWAALLVTVAALAAAIPPFFVPTPGGPGFTSATESSIVVGAAALAAATGVFARRVLASRRGRMLVTVAVALLAFASGIVGVFVSLPHHGGA